MTDKEMEFDELLKQAEAGDVKAMFKVSRAYVNGTGTEVDLEQAFYWEKRAAEANHTIAKYNLALSYKHGIGTHVDLEKYFEWTEKAAKAGYFSAMYNLALAHKKGTGTAIDLDKYFAWIKKAAEKDHVSAIYNLALAYKNGTGTAIDLDKYFEWIKKAAEVGHVSAMFNLSWAYKNGIGTVINLDKYFEWIQKTAEAGHASAMFNLSWAYKNGIGTVINLDKYFEWLKMAAEADEPKAMFNLSLAYGNGEFVGIDLHKCFEWELKAALKGHTDAMFNLAISYKDGFCGDVDLVQYFEWTKKAADANHDHALFNLALCYEEGEGVDVNLELAYDCYMKLGDLGGYEAYYFAMSINGIDSIEFLDRRKIAREKYLSSYFLFHEDFKKIDSELLGCFSDFLELVVNVENEHLYLTTNKSKLYHYTSQDVVHKIVGKEQDSVDSKLRLYMAGYLNDPTEGKYIFKFDFEKNIHDLDLIRSAFEGFYDDQTCLVSDCKEQVYSLSFSENPDNLNLWRAYGRGRNGEANGVNIAISYETLKKYKALTTVGITSKNFIHADEYTNVSGVGEGVFILYTVKYGEESVEKMWKKIAPSLASLIVKINNKHSKEKCESVNKKLLYCVYLAMSRLMYLYKHDAYAAEQEVRALHMGRLTDDGLRCDERQPTRLYFNTPSILFQHDGSEITLGPQMSGEERAVLLWALRKRIVDLGLADKVTIKSSKAPFR